MSDEPMSDPDRERAMLSRWACGDEAATDFLATLFDLSHAADDIVDGDSADPLADMTRVWCGFFGRLMPNPFLQRHAVALSGAIVPAVIDWRVATILETRPDLVARLYAYVLRETLEHAVSMTAYIRGGLRHAHAARTELMAALHLQGEGREDLADWLNECEVRHGLDR